MFLLQYGELVILSSTERSALQLCNILGQRFEEQLLVYLGSRDYSLLIDESNGISVTKLLGTVILHYSHSKKCIVVTYLDLVEVVSCTAGSICEVLKNCITKEGLNLKKKAVRAVRSEFMGTIQKPCKSSQWKSMLIVFFLL
jgi:hypothetical protein